MTLFPRPVSALLALLLSAAGGVALAASDEFLHTARALDMWLHAPARGGHSGWSVRRAFDLRSLQEPPP